MNLRQRWNDGIMIDFDWFTLIISYMIVRMSESKFSTPQTIEQRAYELHLERGGEDGIPPRRPSRSAHRNVHENQCIDTFRYFDRRLCDVTSRGGKFWFGFFIYSGNGFVHLY